jgi:hypothetical protein
MRVRLDLFPDRRGPLGRLAAAALGAQRARDGAMTTSEATHAGLEHTEEELSWVGLAVAGTIRAAELAVIALIALLVCPPLAILTVVVVVPLIALAVVIGAVAAVIALPVFVVRHLHRHRAPHAHELVHRLARLGRKDSALAASRVRRLAARAQAKLYVKRDRRLAPPS